MLEADYDIIIAGSGVAGLYTAVELLRAVGRRLRVAVLERDGRVGGRAYTFKGRVAGHAVQWEAGAGRISERHRLVLSLLKRYGLTWTPIGSGLHYKDTYSSEFEPNHFEPAIPVLLDTLAGLPVEELATHTIRQLFTRVHGAALAESYFIRFPYRAEIDVMRADRALGLFREEMRRQEGYGICVEGLSALTDAMRKEIERRGGAVLLKHEVIGWEQRGAADRVHVELRVGPASEGAGRPLKVVTADHLVLALPAVALRQLLPLKKWAPLARLTMTPLVRIYGVFPKDEATGKRWYEEYQGRIVTSTPIRYIIPGNPAIGSVQMSYTDTQDALYWIERVRARGEDEVGEEVLTELRRLLKPSIPPPQMVRVHAWDAGVSYWLPGRYSPADLSVEALTPFPDSAPGIHICGESFSLRQGWMEGALEHADRLVRRLVRIVSSKKRDGR